MADLFLTVGALQSRERLVPLRFIDPSQSLAITGCPSNSVTELAQSATILGTLATRIIHLRLRDAYLSGCFSPLRRQLFMVLWSLRSPGYGTPSWTNS